MKKFCGINSIVFICMQIGFSQKLSVWAGVNFSCLKDDFHNGLIYSSQIKPAIMLAYQFDLDSSFYINSELGFLQKGAKAETGYYQNNSNPEAFIISEHNALVDYMHFSFTLGYRLYRTNNFQLYVGLGPGFERAIGDLIMDWEHDIVEDYIQKVDQLEIALVGKLGMGIRLSEKMDFNFELSPILDLSSSFQLRIDQLAIQYKNEAYLLMGGISYRF